jgi:hypothetical protein
MSKRLFFAWCLHGWNEERTDGPVAVTADRCLDADSRGRICPQNTVSHTTKWHHSRGHSAAIKANLSFLYYNFLVRYAHSKTGKFKKCLLRLVVGQNSVARRPDESS